MWGALLRAELIRRGRGRAQYVLRAAWVLALYGIVVGLFAAGTYGLGVEAEHIGPFILGQLRDGQALIGCTLAAAIGAWGLHEDRVSGALELAAMTRMSPVQRWLERTAVHQLQLMGLALASAPVLATCLAWGGVRPVQIVLTASGCLVSIALMGAVGSLMALRTDRVLWAWLGTMVWGWLMLIALPVFVSLAGWRVTDRLEAALAPQSWFAERVGAFSPLWAGALAESWDGVWGVLTGVALLGVVLLRGGEALGRVSGGRSRIGLLVSIAVWALGGLVAVGMLLDAVRLPDLGAWRSLVQALAVRGFLLAAGWAALDVLQVLVQPRQRRLRRSWLGPWLDRELRSGAHGGVGVVGWWIAGGVGLLALMGWWSLPPLSTRADSLQWSQAAGMLGLVMTLLSALLSTAEDRRSGAGLAMSPRGPRRLLTARLVGVGARSLPLLLLAALLRDPILALWVPAFWAAVTLPTLALGWGARRPAVAWMMVLGWAFALSIGVAQSTLWGPLGDAVQVALTPLVALEDPSRQTVALSAALYATVAGILGVLVAFRLRRWLARGRG